MVVLAVTAPAPTQLPWDEHHCRGLGVHTHSGLLGCRVVPRGSTVERERIGPLATPASTGLPSGLPARVRPRLLVRAFERQHRGVLHVHPVLGVPHTCGTARSSSLRRYLAEFAPRYGFGFTERKLAKRSGKRVAAYLSSYFVTGKKGKLSLQESVMAPDMPRSIIHVSTELTQEPESRCASSFPPLRLVLADRLNCPLAEARLIATHAIAGTLDLTVDVFMPSPRYIAQVLGRQPPPQPILSADSSV